MEPSELNVIVRLQPLTVAVVPTLLGHAPVKVPFHTACAVIDIVARPAITALAVKIDLMRMDRFPSFFGSVLVFCCLIDLPRLLFHLLVVELCYRIGTSRKCKI